MQSKQSLYAERVFSILQDVYQQSAEPIGGGWSYQQILQVMAGGESLLLWNETKLASFVIYNRLIDGLDIIVLATCVKEQGKGYMQTLLSHLCHQLYPDRSVWLEVHSGNRAAKGLYEKLGFRLCGQRSRYYRDGGDALLYTF